ncbi:MarR family winged helix-turn-helix transcriptional regulator [Luteococcus sp. OSA5]|uniref:MarR family winged helix-turn-helix transcriptional regulator n=1 Tax=Luteococcus sp. OSA5 TaxID=3401630 RepID=UPI003B436975
MANHDETLWLDAEQQRIWRNWLLATARVDYYLDRDLRTRGLDLAEYEILVVLSESEGRRRRMSEVADMVHQSRSRLTHAISRMEKSGWVERCAAPDDRRGVMAMLTDKGYALLEEAAPSHVAAVRRILVDVADPDDFRAMGRVMEAILAVED